MWLPAHELRLRGELGTITWHCGAEMLDQMDYGTRLIPFIRIRLAAPRPELQSRVVCERFTPLAKVQGVCQRSY